MNKKWHALLAVAALLGAVAAMPATADDVVYRIDRTFDPTDTTIGDATVFNIVNATTNLSGVILGKYSIATNGQSAKEYEGVSWGQVSTTQAWLNVVSNRKTIGTYATNIFDDPGWIKGVKSVVLNGETSHGAYMWWLQNTLEFTTPGSTYWTNAGRTFLLENVLVGTLGDYAPGTNYTETFPKMDDADATNYPGCTFLTSELPTGSETVKYSFRTDTYYRLWGVEIRAKDGGVAPSLVPVNNEYQYLQAVATPESDGSYGWAMAPGDTNALVEVPTNFQTVKFTVSEHSAAKDDQEIRLSFSPDYSDTTVTVSHAFTLVEVEYQADEDQVYGFDHIADPPWKSVEKDWTDTVIARVYPTAGIYSNVFYMSTDEGTVTTSPGQGTGSYQTLTIGGSNKTEATTIEARLEATNGPSAGDLKVWCNEFNTNTKMKVFVINDSVHGLTAGTISASALKTWLNDDVFIQAVRQFKEVALVTNDVSYDVVKQDGKLQYGTTNAEYAAITNLMDPVYDVNVFIVNSSTSNGLVGFSPPPAEQPVKPKLCFIMSDRTTEDGARHWTIGHETGHSLFGLGHHDNVPEALMYPHWDKDNWGVWLNHGDWDKVNPVADD